MLTQPGTVKTVQFLLIIWPERLCMQAAAFVREQLWDDSTRRLRRSFCRKPSAVQGFADDYAYLISKRPTILR